jgi:hypothetical protein
MLMILPKAGVKRPNMNPSPRTPSPRIPVSFSINGWRGRASDLTKGGRTVRSRPTPAFTY